MFCKRNKKSTGQIRGSTYGGFCKIGLRSKVKLIACILRRTEIVFDVYNVGSYKRIPVKTPL